MLKGVSILFILIHFFQAFNSPEGGHSHAAKLIYSFTTAGETTDHAGKVPMPLKTTQRTATDFEKEEIGAENDLFNHTGLLTPHSVYTDIFNQTLGKATFRIKDQLHSEIHTPPPDYRLFA